jgi:hypothetical protein
MANQNKLKAWVRYDGTGRVIAGGPILQRFKPKVGNWVEINANECCNDITTTTSTTSTSSTTTTTTTTVAPTTTTTTTADPFFYYLTNRYDCPDCSTITASNFLIKGAFPVNIGDWVIRNPGTGFLAFQVLSAASPDPSAYVVDTFSSSSTCPCPA